MLVQSLYYPAALGTVLVFLVLHVANSIGNIFSMRVAFVALALAFFSTSYALNDSVDDHHYGPYTMLADCVEVLGVLSSVNALGLSSVPAGPPDWGAFYLSMIIVLAAQVGWSLSVVRSMGGKLSEAVQTWPSATIGLISFLIPLGLYWTTSVSLEPWVNGGACLGSGLALALYVRKIWPSLGYHAG